MPLKCLKVSSDRILSTAVGPSWHVRDSTVLEPWLTCISFPRKRLCLLASLACMGEKWAPARAQVSHERVLPSYDASRTMSISVWAIPSLRGRNYR